jgi:hypothetical protein
MTQLNFLTPDGIPYAPPEPQKRIAREYDETWQLRMKHAIECAIKWIPAGEWMDLPTFHGIIKNMDATIPCNERELRDELHRTGYSLRIRVVGSKDIWRLPIAWHVRRES